MLSQPSAVNKSCVVVVEEVKGVSYQVNWSQATAVVSPVSGALRSKMAVRVLSLFTVILMVSEVRPLLHPVKW